MGLSIAGINKLIEKGYVDKAFSEIMGNRIKWNKWSPKFIAYYLINQLGSDNISALYKSISFMDQRCLSKRRLEVLEGAYKILEKHNKI